MESHQDALPPVCTFGPPAAASSAQWSGARCRCSEDCNWSFAALDLRESLMAGPQASSRSLLFTLTILVLAQPRRSIHLFGTALFVTQNGNLKLTFCLNSYYLLVSA